MNTVIIEMNLHELAMLIRSNIRNISLKLENSEQEEEFLKGKLYTGSINQKKEISSL